MSSLEIEPLYSTDNLKEDLSMRKDKLLEARGVKKKNGILYNIGKYTVAVSPVVLPFIIAMLLTGDILASFVITIVFVILLIILVNIYVRNRCK